MSTLIAMGRSGTAWASLWLGFTHDPLDRYSPEATVRLPGICCTAIWMFPKLLALRTGPVVVLDRPTEEVNQSFGIDGLMDRFEGRFKATAGTRFVWTDLFNNPEPIWNLLRPDTKFDPAWHDTMLRFNVQIDMDRWMPNDGSELVKWN